MTSNNKESKSVLNVEEDLEKKAQEIAENQRLNINLSAAQSGGFPFNGQFFYPELDAVDTVEGNNENLVDKLTE